MILIYIGVGLLLIGMLVDYITQTKKVLCSVHSWSRNKNDKLYCRTCGYVFGSDIPEPHPFDD